MPENPLAKFITYCRTHIKGDEKGEAQIFLDRFFTALGYEEGLKGAGASCEFRVRNEQRKSTTFADLLWKPRVLIEMKKHEKEKRGEKVTAPGLREWVKDKEKFVSDDCVRWEG